MAFDIKTLFQRKETESLESEGAPDADNIAVQQRNWVIFTIVLVILAASYGAFKLITAPPTILMSEPAPEFGAVITPDFSDKDTQSALQAQQQDISQLTAAVNKLTRQRDMSSDKLEGQVAILSKKLADTLNQVQIQLDNNMEVINNELRNSTSPPYNDNNTSPSETNINPFGTSLHGENNGYLPRPPRAPATGIQTFSYRWPTETAKAYRRSSQNYVPTGSFVTAVLIGAADANAGVNAQGDTAPILFRTIHDGILPNGKRSHIKDCFVTASVYGEISSNRGIARLQRMSCIFDKDGMEEIIDIPVKGTAFNFGRNGIRGTPVMRNGKIIQMAGVSGLFTGLGDTAKNASSSTITGTAGVVSTVDPSQALLNMGGSALENIGSKLADYYIKLAEQYHPIIELNPGSIVNLVFLEGFPLDAEKIAEYEQRVSGEANAASRVMENFANPLLNMMGNPMPTPPTNPLASSLLPTLKAQANEFDAQRQSPFNKPY